MGITWSTSNEGTLTATRSWLYCEIYLGATPNRFIFCKDAWNIFSIYNMNSDTFTGNQIISEMDDAVTSTSDTVCAVWFRPPENDNTTYGSIFVLKHSVNYESPLYTGLYAGSNEYYEIYRGQFTDATALNITWSKYSEFATFLHPELFFNGLAANCFDENGGSSFYDVASDIFYVALRSATGSYLSRRLFAWHMSTSVWIEVTSLPEQFSTVTSDNGVTFLTGDSTDRLFVGLDSPAHDDKVRIYSFTISTGTWSQITNVPANLIGYAGGSFAHHKLFVHLNSPATSSDVYSYFDFLSSSWEPSVLLASSGRILATAHTDRGVHFYFTTGLRGGLFYRASNLTSLYLTRSAVTDGKPNVDRSAVLDTPWFIERQGVTEGKTEIDRDTIVSGKAQIECDAVVYGKPLLSIVRRGVLICRDSKDIERDVIVKGKWIEDRSAVLRTKQWVDVGGTINAGPNVTIAESLEADQLMSYSCQPIIEETVFGNSYPAFFNRLTVFFNKTSEGNHVSSVTLQSTGSINYYKRTVEHSISLDMVFRQETAVKIAEEFLLQHYIVPLSLTFDVERIFPTVATMDHIEVSHPIGVTERGAFIRICSRVQSMECDFSTNTSRFKALTNSYVWFPPFIQTVQLSDSQLLGGALIDVSGTVERTFTIVEDSSTNRPIQGARVTIDSVTKTTNEFGEVTFLLTPGKYIVHIDGAGYQSGSFIVMV